MSGTADDRALTVGSPAMVGYVLAYNLQQGDRVAIRITDPTGRVVAEPSSAVERDTPRATRSGGRRAPEAGWPAGAYAVEAVVERGGKRWAARRTVEVAQ